MGIEDFDLNNRVIAFVEHGIEKAEQNIMTLFGTEDFFESIVSFRIYEAHRFLLAISISIYFHIYYGWIVCKTKPIMFGLIRLKR
jgi:hypothetical protein